MRCRRCGFARSVRGPGGRSRECPAAGWLASERSWPLAGFSLRRGSKEARAPPSSGLPAVASPRDSHEEDIVFIIGIDPHKGSHTAAVLDVGETACRRAPRRRRPSPTRPVVAVRGTVRTAHVGDRGGRRARGAARPAARRRRRDRRRRAADAVGSGAAVGVGPHRQDRPARRPLGGDRRVAPQQAADRHGRSITAPCCACWRTATTTSSRCAPGRSVGCTPCCACSSPAACPAGCPPNGPPRRCEDSARSTRSTSNASTWRGELLADVRRLDAQLAAIRTASRRRRRVRDHRHRGVRRRPDRRRHHRRPHR